MKTCSPEIENKLLARDGQLSCRWQCVARRAGWPWWLLQRISNKWNIFLKSQVFLLLLLGMSSWVFCIYFLSLVLVSGLNLWMYVPCITKIITVHFLWFKTSICSLICNPRYPLWYYESCMCWGIFLLSTLSWK